MRAVVLATLGSVAALVLACSPPWDDNASGGLANTSWTVRSISGAPTVDAARPTMSFAPDGELTGSTGCNRYSARFRTEGSAIAIAQTASTAVGCPGDVGAQEAAFVNALQGASSWRQTEDGSLVLSGAAEIVAGPGVAEGPPGDPPVANLAGTAWTLADMGGTADFARLIPTLAFGVDGAVSGFAGCNRFSGSYTVTGAALSIGPIAATKMGCEPAASAVEADYLAALAGVTEWFLGSDGELTLIGSVPMTFEPG